MVMFVFQCFNKKENLDLCSLFILAALGKKGLINLCRPHANYISKSNTFDGY